MPTLPPSFNGRASRPSQRGASVDESPSSGTKRKQSPPKLRALPSEVKYETRLPLLETEYGHTKEWATQRYTSVNTPSREESLHKRKREEVYNSPMLRQMSYLREKFVRAGYNPPSAPYRRLTHGCRARNALLKTRMLHRGISTTRKRVKASSIGVGEMPGIIPQLQRVQEQRKETLRQITECDDRDRELAQQIEEMEAELEACRAKKRSRAK